MDQAFGRQLADDATGVAVGLFFHAHDYPDLAPGYGALQKKGLEQFAAARIQGVQRAPAFVTVLDIGVDAGIYALQAQDFAENLPIEFGIKHASNRMDDFFEGFSLKRARKIMEERLDRKSVV